MGRELVSSVIVQKLKQLLAILFAITLLPFASLAQEADTAGPPPAVPQNWWRQSSLQTTPLSPRLLFHAESVLSYEWKTGNMEGNEKNGNAMAALRYKRLTNYFLFEIETKKYDVIPSNSSFEQRRFAIENIVRFDLTKLFYVDADLLYNEDTSIYLVQRIAGYVGPGVYLQSGKFNASFLVGAGIDDKQYSQAVSFADTRDEAVFFMETFHYSIGPMTELAQLSRFIKPLEGPGLSEYNIKVTLTQSITRTVAFVFLFEYQYNRVDIPRVLNRNLNQGIGLQLLI